MTYQEKYERILVGLILFCAIVVIVIMFAGCISEPKKDNYKDRPNPCYDFASCLYLNQKNPDKSVCLPISMECRAYEKYNFCKGEKEMTFNNCWLYLNQK